jgi:hypothetical protein
MNWLGEWIYWLYFAGITAVVAALFVLAVAMFGWNRVKGFLLPMLGVLAVFGLRAKIQQDAYKDRDNETKVVEDKARDEFKQIHDKNEALTEDELDAKNKPFIKP